MEMAEILEQEQKAVLKRLTKKDGWTLGNIVKDQAGDNSKKIIILIK